MAQTTTAMNAVNAKLEMSTDGSTWTNVSGSSNMVDPQDTNRAFGEVHTFDGETPIITTGKVDPTDINIRVLYTPTSGESFALLKTQFETAGSPLYLRWSPGGGDIGDKRYTVANASGTATAGVITKFRWPKGDAADAAPITLEMTVRAPRIVEDTVS